MPVVDADPNWIYCAIYLVTGELKKVDLDARIFTGPCLKTLVKGSPPNKIPPTIATKIKVGNREVHHQLLSTCSSGIVT